MPLFLSLFQGIGKSTTLFGYLNLPPISREGYLWIHLTDDICSIIYSKKSGEVFKTGVFDIEPGIHYSYLKDLVRKISDVTFIVIDGATNDDFHSSLFLRAGMRRDIKAVSCTSRGAKSFRTEICAMMRWPRTVTLESWTFEEYKDAYKKNLPAFRARYKSLEELTEAYFYAGGSMRFMCTDTEEVIDILDNKFNQVSDYSLLLRGLEGDQSKVSINMLMQIIDGTSLPLSKYVSRKLAFKVDDAFIVAASKLNPDNPSWQGLVYERKLINYIQNSLDPLRLFNSTINSFES